MKVGVLKRTSLQQERYPQGTNKEKITRLFSFSMNYVPPFPIQLASVLSVGEQSNMHLLYSTEVLERRGGGGTIIYRSQMTGEGVPSSNLGREGWGN
jgi:hypothetical protein